MVFERLRFSAIVLALIAVTLVVSIAAAVDARHGGALYHHLALIPELVWRGQTWRLVTWTFVERDPFALIFACVTLAWFGGDLVAVWGPRRFARFTGAIVLAAGLGTASIGLVLEPAAHLGGWALGDALVVAWALQFPDRQIRIYGVLVVGGPVLAYGVVALTALFAVFYGLGPFLPELIAGGGALLYMGGDLGRWRAALRRRYLRRHLRVVR